MTDQASQNREAWLLTAAEHLIGWIREVVDEDLATPQVRLSVGWPGGRSRQTTVRGQCWSSGSAEDGIAQIFISPVQADTVTTLAVLLHELVHAFDDCKDSHHGRFIKIARAVGFKASWTSSDNRSDELSERLCGLAKDLGDFPSAAILSGRAADTPKPQTSRQLKAECPSESGYKVRLSQKWIDEHGAPICPCCGLVMEVEDK